jgi:hypothetical protein
MYIIHKHFAPGRSVVISLPSTGRDLNNNVEQQLTSYIQQSSIWPLVISRGRHIGNIGEINFIHGDGSYIILISNGSFSSFSDQINRLALIKNKFTRYWNSEARFIVSEIQKNPVADYEELRKKILDIFARLKIFNCVIVFQEWNIPEKQPSKRIHKTGESEEYTEDMKLGVYKTGESEEYTEDMKLGVYTWFPYQSPDRCSGVNEVTLLDSWVMTEDGHFTNDADLFPQKIGKNLNRCPMRIIARNCSYFRTVVYKNANVSNSSAEADIEGMEIEILKVIIQALNMTTRYLPTPESFELKTGSAYEVFDALFRNKADIVLGAVPNHMLEFTYFDITNTYYSLNLRWYVPCSVKYPRWSSIFRVMSLDLWLALVVSVVFTAYVTTFFGQYGCRISEWHAYKSIRSSLTNVWAVILGVSVSVMPRTPSLRVLFLAWVCFSLAFNTVFQTFLTTYLIDPGYEPPIENMDQLLGSDMKFSYVPEYRFILEQSNDPNVVTILKNSIDFVSVSDSLDWVLKYKNLSVILDDLSVQEMYGRGELIDDNYKPLLCQIEDGVIKRTGYAMIMLHGNALLLRVNEILRRVLEAGLYTKWWETHQHVAKIQSQKIGISRPIDEYYSFSLYHMQPAFYLLLIGCGLSVAGFMVERGLKLRLVSLKAK